MKQLLPPSVTPDMVEEWKHKYGGCKLIVVSDKEDPSKVYKCVVMDPLPRHVIAQAYKLIDKDLYKFSEMLVKNAWLGGDDIIKQRSEYIMSAGGKIAELLDKSEAELINL